MEQISKSSANKNDDKSTKDPIDKKPLVYQDNEKRKIHYRLLKLQVPNQPTTIFSKVAREPETRGII